MAASAPVVDGAKGSVAVANVSAGVVDAIGGAVLVDGAEVDEGSRSMFLASPTVAGSEICCACEGRGAEAPPSVLECGGGPGGGGGNPSSVQSIVLARCISIFDAPRTVSLVLSPRFRR